MRNKRADAICKKLSSVGIKPIRRTLAVDILDPTIDITQNIYLQVGDNYVVAIAQDNSGITHFIHSGTSTQKLINSLREAHNLLLVTEEVWNLKK